MTLHVEKADDIATVKSDVAPLNAVTLDIYRQFGKLLDPRCRGEMRRVFMGR